MDISKKMDRKMEFSSAIYRKIMQYISTVDSFKGSWVALEHQQSRQLKELKKVATIESIGSSTRIEGATLTNTEVGKLLKSVKIAAFKTRDEQEVVGYYETLKAILDHSDEIQLTENYIHQLHGFLLKHSDKDQRHKGKYKSLSNQVGAHYPDGTQRTIFKTTEPHLTVIEMQDVIAWTNEHIEKKDIHSLIIVAVFVYEFLSIHPYQDGNGRLSRLLTTLLMLKQGYRFVQYVSFESMIEAKKEEYYRVLMDGQKNRNRKEERIDKWVLFFLNCIINLIQQLEEKYATYSKLKNILNERQQKIVGFAKRRKTLQIKEIEAKMPDCSRNTLKKDIAYLVNEGVLIKTGAGRGVRYHIAQTVNGGALGVN